MTCRPQEPGGGLSARGDSTYEKVPNHRSIYEHWDFVVDATEKLVRSGIAHLYGPLEGRPKVISPLGVALNGITQRLVLNGMYINSFMKQLRLKYEKLREILTFLKRGPGFISSWDLKEKRILRAFSIQRSESTLASKSERHTSTSMEIVLQEEVFGYPTKRWKRFATCSSASSKKKHHLSGNSRQ
jgi:hypothetical protein